MSAQFISEYYASLSEAQQYAAGWTDGPFLLLAGPGSGKTRVLTARLARILAESREKKFRLLALTFTNQAALEMRDRLEPVVGDQVNRLFVGTIHSFCSEILRQHGSHVTVKPDFQVVFEEEDKRRVLKRALAKDQRVKDQIAELNDRDIAVIPLIDRLKEKLIDPYTFKARFKDETLGETVKATYRLYEAELDASNLLDFSGILLRTYRLATEFPAVIRNVRIAYRYWSVDEFQDTNEALYKVLKALAGSQFKNLFVVADEDQIIYQWNGASYRRIQELISDFEPRVFQLPTNYRCSAEIVKLANNLISYNTLRQPNKEPIRPAATKDVDATGSGVELIEFSDEAEEAKGVAERVRLIVGGGNTVTVLARNRYLLEPLQHALHHLNVSARIMQRRNDFLSVPFSLGYGLLKLSVRNQDEELLSVCVDGIQSVTGVAITVEDVIARARSSSSDYFSTLILELERVREMDGSGSTGLEAMLTELRERECEPKAFVDRFVTFAAECSESCPEKSTDVEEDALAWSALARDIRRSIGSAPSPDRFVQEVDMRSKEAPIKHGEVPLMTIHGSKGMEFDAVVLLGVAEEVLPSWHSIRKGADSPELEEERRNCFVAITRARNKLLLSYARRYKGYRKAPSRFLHEMGIV